jgi:uncharacterized membrane protein YgcG/DNA-directed RNA polymerase subunit RPC12/RpoP
MNEYKCPNCGGSITFDSASQMLKCPYCDTEFDVNVLKSMDDELSNTVESAMDWDIASGEWHPGEQDGLGVFTCQSCGGEIVADENLGSTACPYCGSPVVLTSRFSGTLRPDLVIPFKQNKQMAKDSLKRLYQGKRLLPKVFRDENHIDEIKGMYVPFWLFSADADADFRYKTTRVRTWTSGKYRHTETSYFDVYRGGNIGFDYVPEDGASKISDAMMESVEPFDWSGAIPFQTAYLAGFIADKYDVEAEDCRGRANNRIANSADEAFRQTVTGYSSVSTVSRNIRLHNSSVRYALLPIWFLNTSFKDRKFSFAMNGQTGKFIGDLPVDNGLFVRWLLGIFLALALIFNLLAIPMVAYAKDGQTKQVSFPRFVDDMDLLTNSEEKSLLEKLDKISEKYDCDVAIADIWSLDDPIEGTDYRGVPAGYGAQDYADAWLWEGGFGIGEGRDAIVLLLALEDRDYAISTYGFGITAVTEAGLDYMENDMLPYLRKDDYNRAFQAFADDAAKYLEMARNGKPFDYGNLPADPFIRFTVHLMATFFALIVALIVVLSWRRKMKSVKPSAYAREYVRRGSFHVVRQHERFMYKNVSSVKIETSSSSGSSSHSSGSKTHTSSGGRSHGGRSGKF